jgi:hypothetical protein
MILLKACLYRGVAPNNRLERTRRWVGFIRSCVGEPLKRRRSMPSLKIRIRSAPIIRPRSRNANAQAHFYFA